MFSMIVAYCAYNQSSRPKFRIFTLYIDGGSLQMFTGKMYIFKHKLVELMMINVISFLFGINAASPICQEGQRERTFQNFAFSSQIFFFCLTFSPHFWYLPNSLLEEEGTAPPFHSWGGGYLYSYKLFKYWKTNIL